MSRKTQREKYQAGYERGADGSFVYTGPRYRYALDARGLLKLKLVYAGFALALLAAFVLASFSAGGGSRVAYVVLPYTATFLPVALICGCVGKIILNRGGLTQRDYDKSVVRLKQLSGLAALLSALALIGEGIYVMRGGALAGEGQMLAGCALIMVLSGVFYTVQEKYKVAKE